MKFKIASSMILLAFVGVACSVFASPTPTPLLVVPTAVISTSIPPTSVAPTATLPPSLPNVPTLAPLPQATAAAIASPLPLQATATTQPPAQSQTAPTPSPKRISFAAGATSATVQGTLSKNGMDRWAIRVQAGQTMTAKATAQNGSVMLIVFGVNGDVYQTDHVGSPDFSMALQTTQDYYIDVRAYGDTAPTYTLLVSVPPLPQATVIPAPKRITFAPNAIDATVQGVLTKNGFDRWVIRVQAGQTMTVKATPQNGSVSVNVIGSNGAAYQNTLNSLTDFSTTIRASQDHYIDVQALNNTAPTYTLQVTIPPK